MAKQELPFPALKSVQKWYDGLDNSKRMRIDKSLELLHDMTVLEQLTIGGTLPSNSLERLPLNPKNIPANKASRQEFSTRPQLYSLKMHTGDGIYFALHDGQPLLLSVVPPRGQYQQAIEDAQNLYLQYVQENTPPTAEKPASSHRADQAEHAPPAPVFVEDRLWGNLVKIRDVNPLRH